MSNFLPRWCLTRPSACQVTPCKCNLFTLASDTCFLCRYSMWSCLVQFTTACSSNHTLRHLNRWQQMFLVHNERNTKTILRQWAEVGLEDSKVCHTTKTLVTYYCSRHPHCSAALCCTLVYGATQGQLCHSYRLPLTSSMFLAQGPSRLVNVVDISCQSPSRPTHSDVSILRGRQGNRS